MSKFFKIGLALVCSFFVTTTLYAQSTIEEVIVTAQRTEQSLQDVPIAVSAFTNEMLAERQIEYASDIQLQVPGISFTATTFGAGGFSIRGITNLATAASSDAGVEIHMNGLPLGLTSVSEIQYLDMERLEVLRGPQGTLFGRNATGGVINLVTAKPTLDEFYGSVDIKYGQDKEQMVTAMLNVPITDQLGFRFAYTNLQKDGIHENLYQFASNDFDDRDGYQWRASFLYEFDDTLRLNLIHNSYDEESNRNQVSGSICQTGANLIQGCVVGGQQVFQQISPMSNGSTLPSLLGQNLGFYFPGNLGCSTDANGAIANNGTCYNPLVGFETAAAEQAAAGSNALHAALVSVPNIPTEFFQANLWASPRHETQESTSQLLLEKDFDQGQLTFSINEKQRVFYRDTSSLSADALSIRWADGLVNNGALYLQDGATLGGVTGRAASAANPLPQIGVPLGYSNPYLNGATCDIDTGNAGIFGGAACIQGFHELPVSGDASFSKSNGTTYEIKYSSDLDGMFNFLVGAIDISTRTESFYNVYASGITMNGLQLPGSISKSYRDAYYGFVGCAFIDITAGGYNGPCDATSVATGGKVVAGIGINDGTLTLAQAGTMATALAAVAAGTADATQAATAQAAAASQLQALDKISRIDGVYTEYFHNQTNPFNLNARAIFTEFYFDVANNHKLTVGLRYTQDKKDLQARATFYDTPLVTAWDTTDADFALAANTASGNDETAAVHCGITGGVAGEGAASIAADGTVTAASAACLAIGATVGQAIGSSPVVTLADAGIAANESQYLINGLDAYNADYAAATPPITPVLDFTKTTGRLVWDWQMNDDTLMYASYSKGFKGGGFNPPFDAAQFPNTPFAFESTDVQALEFGIKATVPEVGLVANASFYYNDFDNFHLGTIRNETAINLGIPLKSMGAELELLLNPPTVPGLTFNMNLSLYDSEIGDVSIVNPHDLGGHYNGTTASANWHVMKSASANSFLVNKDRFGYMYGSILQAKAAVTAAADDAALIAAFTTLSATNELAAAAEAGRLALLAATPAATDAQQAGVITATMAATALVVDPEMSAHATAYGTMGSTCHFMQVTANAAYINTCMNDAAAAAVGMTGANVATAYDPAVGDSLVYSPVEITDANGLVLATSAANGGALLPSIGILGSGDAIQTTGLCTLWGIFTADYSGLPGGHTSALTDDAGTTGTTGIQVAAADAQGNATETCYGTATTNPGLISSGLEQSIEGNPMPFSDLTMSLGIAYTFQTNNLEITPRLDYYYRSETNASVFDIEQNKLPAWDEVNFRLNIVPTNGDWRVVFYGQNLTDDRNITATALTNSSQSFTNTAFVREPRSFGFQFGLDF